MAKVLLVDDDELVVYALGRYLRKAGHQVIELNDGLKVVKTVIDEKPDVVVTDIIMPEVEGLEVILNIRKIMPDLPIIAMSGGGRRVDVQFLGTAKDLGANAILEKPFDEKELDNLIGQLAA